MLILYGAIGFSQLAQTLVPELWIDCGHPALHQERQQQEEKSLQALFVCKDPQCSSVKTKSPLSCIYVNSMMYKCLMEASLACIREKQRHRSKLQFDQMPQAALRPVAVNACETKSKMPSEGSANSISACGTPLLLASWGLLAHVACPVSPWADMPSAHCGTLPSPVSVAPLLLSSCWDANNKATQPGRSQWPGTRSQGPAM